MKETQKNQIFKKSKLKIIPLRRVQRNRKKYYSFEYEDEIVVVGCGLSFPDDDMLGIDLVIPDITYLEKNVDKIKGISYNTWSWGPYWFSTIFIKKDKYSNLCTKLAAGLIRNKLEEHNLLRSTKLYEVEQGQTIKFGNNFKVEFIRSTHSIPDSVMLAITTPVGTILHTGDFKVVLHQ